MELRASRILVLTGLSLSLIVCALSLFVHNRLYGKDLERAGRAEAALRASLGEPASAPDTTGSGAHDAIDAALAQQPAVRVVNSATFYDDAELKAFVSARARDAFDAAPEARSLTPPANVHGEYQAGIVNLTWDPGPLNRVLATTLTGQGDELRLAFRIYRGEDLQAPELAATVPFGVASWHDNQLPLGKGRLAYEVWTVLLRGGADGDVLVGAERSEMVTVETPEHFTLSLLDGAPESAVIEVQVDLPAAAGRATITVHPGQSLMVGDRPTGLVLQSIMSSQEERLTTQRRLLLTSDGSLVLDPTTNEPRTTQMQVLLPVTRWTAMLLGQDGETRTLMKDLP